LPLKPKDGICQKLWGLLPGSEAHPRIEALRGVGTMNGRPSGHSTDRSPMKTRRSKGFPPSCLGASSVDRGQWRTCTSVSGRLSEEWGRETGLRKEVWDSRFDVRGQDEAALVTSGSWGSRT